ncbi:MAG: hypothetical protein CL762_04140 [Chloroflexi bacterium]|nr:hypothetical protein [Chloroflexota bacterium]|tara:strand:- start:3866 stop:4831 length:966 start_codon:yes stop_codon:yes gene_type:complete
MKVARLTSRKKIEFTESDIIEPRDGECLLKVKVVSICGTDVRREFDKDLPEDNYPLPIGTPCHEVVGEIYRSRSKLFNEGERVLAVPTADNGLQEYLTLNENRFVRLPDEGPLDEWVMCQHSGTVLYASKKWGDTTGKTIAVLGQGGIGISFSMIASMKGASKVIGIDLNQSRLDIASNLGTTHSINPENSDLIESISEITNGDMADIVIEATGRPEGLNSCVDIVKKHGTVICFGLTTEEFIPFSQNNFLSKNCTMISTLIAGTSTPLKEIKEMIELRKKGLIDPGKLKTHNMSWLNVQEAFDLYSSHSEGLVKIALKVS